MTQVRMKREDRRLQLLQIACQIAYAEGIHACTRASVAAKAGITAPNVNRYWANPELMRRDVLQTAADAKDAKWLKAQGVKLTGIKMSSELRKEIAKG